MVKLKTFLQTKPVFLYLLPVFFVFHVFTENSHYSIVKEALQLTGIYLLASLLIALLCWPLFKNFYKACLVTCFIMSFNFFFGSLHDFLKNNFEASFILKYTFIVPAVLLILLLLIIYLRKTKKDVRRFGIFLNTLLLFLIAIDIVLFLPAVFKPKISHTADLSDQIINCDSCNKPDIYLIIADEYAGKTQLKEIFSFDNSAFENELRKRGFHIASNTKSNYNATVYSMASMFSMDYIHGLKKNFINHPDMFICRDIIKKNNLTYFLKKNGYETFNFSPFGFSDKKNFVVSTFFVSKKELFISQTFVDRIFKQLGYHFIKEKQIRAEKDKHLYNNNKIDSATRFSAKIQSSSPKFVYTHVALPHFPYYFDSSGNKRPFNPAIAEYPKEEKDYIQYLIYANKRLLNLVDHIKASATRPPVIILMSDHGYRQFTRPVDTKYYFMNFNAVYLPDENYKGFYDGMSNVNQFRVILNSVFSQQFSMLKDSTSFLAE